MESFGVLGVTDKLFTMGKDVLYVVKNKMEVEEPGTHSM